MQRQQTACSGRHLQLTSFPCAAVSLDGTPLAIRPGQNELDHIVESEDVQALLTIHWHLHREDFGHSVELQTGARRALHSAGIACP